MTGLANEIDLAVQLAPPPVADDEGIALAVHHLEFVGLDAQAVADWRARRSPLGMSPAVYRDFCESFFAAGRTDRVPDLDARLKGSAAIIFSGRHKALPASWGEHVVMFAQAHGGPPTPAQEVDLRDRFERFWRHRAVPRRRPFDCMFALNLDTHRSDYDIQVSSAEIERRCSVIHAAYPQLAPRLHHPRYGFLDDVLVGLAVPAISRWANGWTTTLTRTVAVKAFGVSGPGNTTASAGHLSSHFRVEDWMMRAPRAGVD